ncbi:6-phosphogluconolactonase [Propionivibrio limicola]|uniref:6-phosphogluconolactonase n=1 Tax=Propionivibrio limicola TaxID=167645 RepID=UPI001290C3F3|nr:6-phosphogluconolactonase [Propionivibrio limicola]
MPPDDIRVFPDSETVAAEACRFITAQAQAALRQRGIFRLVLAGGSTPKRTYERLAETAQNWCAWEIFWSDERCLPADHPQRNSRMAQDAWLNHVAIPDEQIHPIPAELGAENAATAYARTIRDKQPFDLVILGVGEDGHTASLFADTEKYTRPVVAVHDAPYPPPDRVSLGFDTLWASRHQLVIVTGKRKAEPFAAWRHGDDMPIARAARRDACVLVDKAAAGCILCKGTPMDSDVSEEGDSPPG